MGTRSGQRASSTERTKRLKRPKGISGAGSWTTGPDRGGLLSFRSFLSYASARARMSRYLPMAMYLCRDPSLYWPPARLPDFRPGFAPAGEQRQRGAEPAAGLIAPEEVANGRSAHSFAAGMLEGA